MREIVMDTETTGLDPQSGDRIVEIGGVELINHLPTGRTYHQYINPKRSMPREAFEIHGLGDDFLRDYPTFDRIADAFIEFIGDAKLVIHNAKFDMMFLNAELGWLNKPLIPMEQSLDTLAIARQKFPGAQASLDALCKRFGVDNSAREKHGALLDSEILAEVYLELLGGRQQGLTLATQVKDTAATVLTDWVPPPRPGQLTPRITDAEAEAHTAFIAELGDDAIWLKH